jgi:hypothetical protein
MHSYILVNCKTQNCEVVHVLINYLRVVLVAGATLVTFFAWGFLTEGWLIRKDFAALAPSTAHRTCR